MAEVLEKVENVDGRLVERLQRLERLVEALLDKPIQVTITMPERPNMGCEQAELYRLADLLYLESCTGHENTEPCKRLLRLINDLKAWSLDELKTRLGL